VGSDAQSKSVTAQKEGQAVGRGHHHQRDARQEQWLRDQ
jgi:hypothetical protein